MQDLIENYHKNLHVPYLLQALQCVRHNHEKIQLNKTGNFCIRAHQYYKMSRSCSARSGIHSVLLFRISNTYRDSNPFDQNRAITYSIAMFSVHQDLPQNTLFEMLQDTQVIRSMNFSDLQFHNMDLSGKIFYECCFSRTIFSDIKLDGSRFRMCFFDFARFTRCSIIGADIQFSSFAGVHVHNSTFENSDLLHNNFNGLLASNSSFNDSDLYNSRFIMASLKNTSFQNCNLKKTIFFKTTRHMVSFKSSNTREALFGKGENPE